MSYQPNIEDLSRIAEPKSDQLNADDLIGGAITANIINVRLSNTPEQPLIIDIDGGYKPYKPCKSMSRLLIFCWGKDGRQWIGRSLTMYNDPDVTWAGVKVGGIRISHLSDLTKDMSIALTVTRGKRKPYTVKKLQVPNYPQDDFDKNLPAWDKAIKAGKTTAQDLIAKVQQRGLLTSEMKSEIMACEPQPEEEVLDATNGDEVPDL